jgi:hypothetical protein
VNEIFVFGVFFQVFRVVCLGAYYLNLLIENELEFPMSMFYLSSFLAYFLEYAIVRTSSVCP